MKIMSAFNNLCFIFIDIQLKVFRVKRKFLVRSRIIHLRKYQEYPISHIGSKWIEGFDQVG